MFREEIAEPLGADFHIGLPASEDERVAELIPPPPGEPTSGPASDLQRNMLTNPPLDPTVTPTRAWRGAEIPAANGTGNARSVAEIHMILANGGVAKGKRLLSEAGCRRALDVQVEGPDLIIGQDARFGMGFSLAGGLLPLPSPNSMFWGGHGGSIAIIDMDARTTIAYAMNRMGPLGDGRAFGLATTVWQALELV